MSREDEIEPVLAEARRLKRIPEKLQWPITGVIFGHGKVLVQAVDGKGKAVQFTGKVGNAR